MRQFDARNRNGAFLKRSKPSIALILGL